MSATRPDTAPPARGVPPADAGRPSGVDILGPVKSRLALAALIAGVGAMLHTAPLFATVEIARRMLAGRDDVWWVVTLLCVALVLRWLFILGSGLYTHVIDLDLSFQIRRDVLTHLRRLPLAWFTDRNSGMVRKAVEDDTAALHRLVAHSVFEIVSAVVPAVIALVYLFLVDWRLALFAVVPIVIGGLGYGIAMRGASEKIPEYNSLLEQLSAASVEFVHGIAVVKSFGQAGHAHQQFTRTAEGFGRFFLGWMRASTRPSIVLEMAVAPLSMLAVLIVGGWSLVTWGGLPAVDLVAFIVFGTTITAGIMLVLTSLHDLDISLRAKKHIEEFLSTPTLPVRKNPVPPTDPSTPGGREVRFEGVSFSYGSTQVLHDIDLTLRPGTVTALVGPSGSGKSTVASLLPRFADPKAGRILLGGVDLRDLDPAELYRVVSFVFQENRLLRGTVAENIALAAPDCGVDAIRRAAAAAQILERLDALPRGLDSVIGEDAILSGGETQRVCIARAILADTPVLVLDEATASADPENEARIQDALSALAAERTVLVIAHRLSTIRGADQIAVLDSGRVVELGDHDSLLGRACLYHRMWEADQAALTSTNRGNL